MGAHSVCDPDLVLAAARDAGFDEAGIAPPSLPDEAEHLRSWLDAGHAGGMRWLERHFEVRVDLRERFSWARSVVVVLRSYRPAPNDPDHGLARFVSSYARGADYHDVLLPRLRTLEEDLRARWPSMRSHPYVDTGPAMERALAVRAGLGWIGRNTLLLHPRHGSRFFLGVLVTDLDLPPTTARTASCGRCRACRPACPTNAFVAPGVLDARRCISYLTIEHRGPIDRALRPAMGQWLFGCDLCQTCCPFEMRRNAPGDPVLRADGGLDDLDLPSLLRLDEAGFRARFGKTPLSRPKREGLLRNALIVAANGEHDACLSPARALLEDPSAVLREAASWCLGRLGSAAEIPVLETARDREDVEWVRQAMDEDLGGLRSGRSRLEGLR